MHNARCMRGGERVSRLPDEAAGIGDADLIQGVSLEGFAFDELQHNERHALVFAERVDRADVGMIEPRGRLRFADKPLHAMGVAGKFRRYELERHMSTESRFQRLIDHTHAAAAQLGDDLIARHIHGLSSFAWRREHASQRAISDLQPLHDPIAKSGEAAVVFARVQVRFIPPAEFILGGDQIEHSVGIECQLGIAIQVNFDTGSLPGLHAILKIDMDEFAEQDVAARLVADEIVADLRRRSLAPGLLELANERFAAAPGVVAERVGRVAALRISCGVHVQLNPPLRFQFRLLSLQKLPHPFAQPAYGSFGPARLLADLLCRETLQAEFDHRPFICFQATEQILHYLRQHGRVIGGRFATYCRCPRRRIVRWRNSFASHIAPLGLMEPRPIGTFPNRDGGQQGPQTLPAVGAQDTFAVPQQEAFIRRLHDVLGIDLMLQPRA